MDTKYTLDDGVLDSFEFSVFGVSYKFRYLNTSESVKFSELESADREAGTKTAEEFLYSFITPVEDNETPFKEASQKMTSKHWQKFQEMIKTEFGL